MNSALLLTAENSVWGLQGLCQFHRLPFNPKLVLQHFPPPYDLLLLQQAATALGLRSGLRSVSSSQLPELPVPFVAVLRPSGSPDDTGGGEDSCPGRLAVVLKCDSHSITYLEQGRQHPWTRPLEGFAVQFTGMAMLCIPEPTRLKDKDVAATGTEEFGFRWFIPELLRHKSIWRDVLLASLAIQVMALATPIFTQVVIDKVIVHHTASTLAVIGIALGIFIVFTAVMSWVRQYLVPHTGNRIDAVLGSQVFTHLFSLPPKYFERRPTGVLVARLQGVETVVAPGTILLTLVPSNEPLVAEVWVGNTDAGFVQANQKAKIKLAPYPFHKHGMLDGTVQHINADAQEHSEAGASQPKAMQEAAYRALINLDDGAADRRMKNLKLIPGMQVSAEIHLGTRSVVEYLLSPIRKTAHEAGRER